MCVSELGLNMWTGRSKGLAPGKLAEVPCHWCRLKCNFDNLIKTLVAKQRLNMCTRTGIENVYWGDQGLAPGKAWPSEVSAVV